MFSKTMTKYLLPIYVVSVLLTMRTHARPQTEDTHPADDLKCPEDRVSYFVTPHVLPLASYSYRVDEVELDQCRSWCSKNFSPQGKPADCASFTYNNETKQCKLYAEKTFPDGVLERRDTKKPKNLYEKYCLPEVHSTQCAKVDYRRVDEKILKGYAQATAMVRTLGDCMTECIKERDFRCKSAMFFYEEGECITNMETDSPTTDQLIDPEDDDRAIFIQNDCYAKENHEELISTEATTEQAELNTGRIDVITHSNTSLSTTPKPVTESSTTSAPTSTAPILEQSTIHDTQLIHEEIAPATKDNQQKIDVSVPLTNTADIRSNRPISHRPQMHLRPVSRANTGNSSIVDQDAPDDGPEQKRPELYGAKILSPNGDNESLISANSAILEPTASKPAKVGAPASAKKLKVNPLHTESFQRTQQADQPALPPRDLDGVYFSLWSNWTPCHMAGEKRIRRRKCLDLKRCRGSLMQMENCPPELIKVEKPTTDVAMSEDVLSGPVGPARQPLPVVQSTSNVGAPPSILPPKLNNEREEKLPEGAPGNPEDVWSPWLGVCQHFASTQPCRNGQMIGFESRECVAKDPKFCQGPFFRYCMLKC